ncbi:hypothetical protein N9I19_18835 [Peribacillus sp. CSMR9]|nr:hypothetical protein [Peribacillus sp. CSMR9]
MEVADHLRHHEDKKPIYAKRKEQLSEYSQMEKKSMACVGQR